MKKAIYYFGRLSKKPRLIGKRPTWKRQKRMEKRFWKTSGQKGYLVGG